MVIGEKPHLFKHAKHRLAQLMTVERERQIAADAESAEKLVAAKEAADSAPSAEVSQE